MQISSQSSVALIDKYFNIEKMFSEPEDELFRSLSRAIFYGKRESEFQTHLDAVDIKKTWRNRWTLLHIACMAQSNEVLEELLFKGADINARDCSGFTALHICSLLGNKLGLNILLKNGADVSLTNFHGGTHEDIERLLAMPSNDTDRPIPLQNACNQGMTALEFFKLTGTQYLHQDNYVTREFLVASWARPQHRIHNYACPAASAELFYAEHFPHCLKEASPGNLGLFATRSYAPGEFIGEYLCKISHEPINSIYSIEPGTDAKDYGNEISRINDGFPNCHDILVPCWQGLHYRVIMRAAAPIKAGEQFLWNYIWEHPVKTQKGYVIFRKEAIREFVATEGAGLQYSNKNPERNLKINYILDTPAVAFFLLLEGLLTPEKFRQLRSDYVLYRTACWYEDNVKINDELMSVAQLWCSFEPDLPKEYTTDLIQSYCDKISVEGYIPAFQLIKKHIETLNSILSCNRHLSSFELINFLKVYYSFKNATTITFLN